MRENFDWKDPSWINLLITIPWGIVLLVSLFRWSVDHAVAKRERTTTGIITRRISGRTARYQYVFSVNGVDLMGTSGSNERHAIGDLATVFYDPIDANENDLTDYKELANEKLGLLPVLIAGIGGVAFYIWYVRKRKTPE